MRQVDRRDQVLMRRLRRYNFVRINDCNQNRDPAMADVNELSERGLRRRKRMLGEAQVESRMAAAGDFGAPL